MENGVLPALAVFSDILAIKSLLSSVNIRKRGIWEPPDSPFILFSTVLLCGGVPVVHLLGDLGAAVGVPVLYILVKAVYRLGAHDYLGEGLLTQLVKISTLPGLASYARTPGHPSAGPEAALPEHRFA